MKLATKKLAISALAGAWALTSSIALAQTGGTSGGASSNGSMTGSSNATPPAGNPPAATTGQAKSGTYQGGSPNMPANPSGNSLINSSPSGSTLGPAGSSSGVGR